MENVRVYGELEQRVRDRTAGLETANRELEAFSYAVSHDLRAPLRHIDGFAQMLVEDSGESLDDKARERITRIRSSTHRMGQLIEDLLSLSRTTQTALRRGPVDLADIAREVAAALQAAAPDRRAQFVIPGKLIVDGDARLLRVVFENLLSNAWKFTARRDVARIEVAETTDEDGRRVIRIGDNGAGFDMAHASRLFGVFERLHRDDDFPGTGIGLATVQRVIQKHGGRIWAEAAVDRGATFLFTLG
jgi:light-regulated signal transduction histidine kinase (bacteriophytochrome)